MKNQLKKKENNKTTLPYSQRNPERGIAISCNGLWITLSIKAFTLAGCMISTRCQITDESIGRNDKN